MSRLFQLGLLLLALQVVVAPQPASAGPIHRAPHKGDRSLVTDLEEQWRTATLDGDLPAMNRLLSDDYVGISWNGQVNTKASQIDRLRNRNLVLTKLDLSDMKVKILGQVAIVTSRADVEGTNDGVDMKGAFIYTRIYKRLASGTWKITNFEATRVPDPAHHHGRDHGMQQP